MLNRHIDIYFGVWPFNAALALLQFPAFFLYFPTCPASAPLYYICLSLLLSLCCLYRATGFLGPLFIAVIHIKQYLFIHYTTVFAGLLWTSLYWVLIQITHPSAETSLDRLVIFLLACLGSRMCSPFIHDHCVTLALATMTVSLTESLVSFREWFGTTIEMIFAAGIYRRRFLAKVRVVIIAILVAVLLKTSISPQTLKESKESKNGLGGFPDLVNRTLQTSKELFHLKLTARECMALFITLLIAVHLVAREIGILGLNTYIKRAKNSLSESHVPIRESPKMDDPIQHIIEGKLSLRSVESQFSHVADKIKLRNNYLSRRLPGIFQENNLCNPHNIETKHFYESVEGTCCENVVGFVPIPLGFVGPLKINDVEYFVPMATTEGALVASTSRGCKLLSLTNGVKAYVVADIMTRGPVFKTDSLETSILLREYIESIKNYKEIRSHFENTSRYARLTSIHVAIGPSTHVFVRFSATTGDAMGMNMISKATENAVSYIIRQTNNLLNGKSGFVKLIALSGNFCTDKKSSSSNWLNGRGKSVVAEAFIPDNLIRKHMKVDNPQDLVNLNTSKNLLGSAMSASQPGASCNAQAANVVAAIFAACGQDLGQVGTSSACMTWIERQDEGIRVSVTMPCIEVGTIGGGTKLPIQNSCLKQLGVAGSSSEPGQNAKTFACVISATVMAAEISLMSALCTNDLVKAHMDLNRTNESRII